MTPMNPGRPLDPLLVALEAAINYPGRVVLVSLLVAAAGAALAGGAWWMPLAVAVLGWRAWRWRPERRRS